MARARRLTAAHALQLPGLAMVVVALALAVFDGGYAGSTWYPVGVLAVALLVMAWLAVGRLWRVPAIVTAGLGAFAAFCVWSYASIMWADAPGPALEGANRALLYLVTLTLVVVVPWPARAARAALALVAIGASAIAAGTLASLSGDSLEAFIDGRLLTPLGYANATANFWCMAMWPALMFATGPMSSRYGRLLRPVALGSAGLLAQTALLCQSRGAVIAVAVTALLFVALTPRRGQALLALLALATATAVAWSTLIDVRTAASTAVLDDAIGAARTAIVVSVIALVLVAAGFDGLMQLLPRLSTRLGTPRVGNRAAAATAVALAAAALAAIGNPVSWIDSRWDDFKGSGYEQIEPTGSRLSGSLGSGRYDYWRVSLNEFLAHPVAGIGADNFHAAYLRERRTLEAPRHPHSLAMRLLAQLGVVGTTLFVAFLGAIVAAAWRVRRSADRLVSTALLSAFATWLVHAQVDWLWAFPALGMLAFTLLGIAARLQKDAPGQPRRVRHAHDRETQPVALMVVVVAGALAVCVAFFALGAASRAANRATERATDVPRLAITDYEQAARLDPLSAEPLIVEAVIARRLGDRNLARRSLRRALAREPENWFAHLELGLLDATSGRRGTARQELERARELNPRQPVIGEVMRAVRRRTPIDPDAVETELNRQRDARLQPFGAG